MGISLVTWLLRLMEHIAAPSLLIATPGNGRKWQLHLRYVHTDDADEYSVGRSYDLLPRGAMCSETQGKIQRSLVRFVALAARQARNNANEND
jgi:hypothetical protein